MRVYAAILVDNLVVWCANEDTEIGGGNPFFQVFHRAMPWNKDVVCPHLWNNVVVRKTDLNLVRGGTVESGPQLASDRSRIQPEAVCTLPQAKAEFRLALPESPARQVTKISCTPKKPYLLP